MRRGWCVPSVRPHAPVTRLAARILARSSAHRASARGPPIKGSGCRHLGCDWGCLEYSGLRRARYAEKRCGRDHLVHDCVRDLLRPVTRDAVARADVAEFGLVGHAILGIAEALPEPAARMETTSRRRVRGRRDIPCEDEALLAHPRVRVRY